MESSTKIIEHVNIETDESKVPDYAFYSDDKICGFFGVFRFLSNFFPIPGGIHYEGLQYRSVEHAYQAAKWPQNKRREFTLCSAGQAKKLGKQAPDFDKIKWDKKKYGIMAVLVFQKFTSNSDLKEMLLATGDAHLEETNSWGDTYWGCDEDGNGQNNLGKILMDVRETIRKNKL